MGALDVVKALDAEISGGDMRKVPGLLADDFKFVGVAPEPLDRDHTVGMWSALRAAMPDFTHNLSNTREAYSIVYATVEVTGTHTGTFQAPGAPTLAPTGRKLRNPIERVAITVRNGRVTQWAVEQVPGGGLGGLLGQLS